MNNFEQELETRVDRKFKPLMRVIWSGFIAFVIWMVLIAGVVMGIIGGEMLVAVGLLSLLLPGVMGILLARETIKIDMIEKEENRMAELGLLEKRKNSAPERIGLSDEGELIDYDAYAEEESRPRRSTL